MTTPEFRERYLRIIRETAAPISGRPSAPPSKLSPRSSVKCPAIGAALVALLPSY